MDKTANITTEQLLAFFFLYTRRHRPELVDKFLANMVAGHDKDQAKTSLDQLVEDSSCILEGVIE